MTSKSSLASRNSMTPSREIMGNMAFQRAVERAANFKCLQAIRAGKLRVVQRENTVNAGMPIRFTPRMDLIDDPTTNTLSAIFELPGIKTADVSLQIREGNLVITGERRVPAACQSALAANAAAASARTSLPRNPLSAADSLAAGDMEIESSGSPSCSSPIAVTMPVHELRFGQFYRAIPVPEGIKEADVTAALQDGMLTVTWPKYPIGRTVQSVTPPASPSITGTAAQ